MRARALATILGLVFCAVVAAGATAQESLKGGEEEELRSHLEALGRRLDDPTADLVSRQRIALEMASTLDRAAVAAPADQDKRARWAEAADVLDRFSAKNAGHSQERAYQVQAAVYLWARARTWFQEFQRNPVDTASRDKAVEALGASAKRFQTVYRALDKGNDVFAQNVRYRTAQALADLAEIGPYEERERATRNHDALLVIWAPVTEPSLSGFAHLLRATLLGRIGRVDDAEAEVRVAEAATPAPPASEVLDARLAGLLGAKRYPEALKAIDAAKVEAGAKTAMRARVRLEERIARVKGPERAAVELALFDELKALRASGRPETRATLIAAARALREPGPGQSPDAWDLLAEGAAAVGDLTRAGTLEREGAGRADALGQAGQAAEYRLRAGAYFFQAEKFAEADPLLTRVAEDPKAGPGRARAGLLRALARGRALAMGRPGVSQADYAAALRAQIQTFPDDPSASEARWLLGKLLMAGSDRDGALALWAKVPHGSPRWLDSRVEIAAVRQHDLDAQRLNNDRDSVSRRTAEARAFLASCLGQAQGDREFNEIRVAQARLELTPGVGRPEEAQTVLERFQRSAAQPDQRDAARRLNVVALAQLGRWVLAEQAARKEVKLSEPAALLPIIRLLDRSAAEAESDLRTRRMGHLLRILLAPVQERPQSLPPNLRAEARLRVVRALLFSGDDAAARRDILSWTGPPPSAGNDLLRDLAETYTRLEAYDLAVEVQRRRAKVAPTGSLNWFDARYGLALAYYRSGNSKDALHLIETTAILHPDLGGGDLRDKFIRLRQRIAPSG